jgi:dipeptidyl aminopeptidase/acylaminoacyl peptidase
VSPLLPRLAALALAGGLLVPPALAQNGIDAKSKEIAALEQQIAAIQSKIAELKGPTTKKPLTLAEANTWRSIRGAALSPDGVWFAHRVGPAEGDGELILKATKGDKEIKFPGGGGFAPMAFSADGKWFATTVSPAPPRPGAGVLALAARRVPPKVVLVNLASGEKTELEGFQSFAFNRDGATHLALRKAAAGGPSPAISGGPIPGIPTPGLGASEPPSQGHTGTDLVLRELATGLELTLGNVSEYSFNKQGTLLAMVIDSAGQTGNGVQLRDMKTGALLPLDTAKANYQGLNWNESGDALVVLKGVEDKAVEGGKSYSVIGFTEVGPAAKKAVYDPKSDSTFPKGMGISTNRTALWTDDLSALSFGIVAQKPATEPKREEAKKEDPKEPEPKKDGPGPGRRRPSGASGGGKPDLVVWHWKDERLQSQQQVEESRDKSFTYLCVYRVKEKKFLRLADDVVRNVQLAPKHKFAVGSDLNPYQLMSTLDGKRFEDIYVTDLATGERKKALTKVRWVFGASPDGTHLLYHDDGHFRTLELATLKTFNISENTATSFVDAEDDHNIEKPPTRTIGWSADGKAVLVSDGWDIWQLGVHGESPTNLTLDGKAKGIRYRGRAMLDPEEKGIDLTKPMYIPMMEERTKKAGYGRIEPGKPGLTVLAWADAQIGSPMKAKHADVFVYSRQTNQDPPDFYVTDASLKDGKRVTDLKSQQAGYKWSAGARLVDYVGLNGKPLQAALFLPADYKPGQRYPTIVYIYEKLSDGLHMYMPPGTGGFNKSIYTSNGYAVLMPDIKYQLNDPGVSAVKCILPALDAAIASGVVDPARVGLHGHSWGGYQTAFLVTQTDRFKAAIAGAPLTDLISMYSSIYWNAGITNQQIFESSQGRFTGGYWEQQEAYIRNSPVYHARNVTTPLVILHNDKDGAVDFTQGIEYFNTLRRLQKPVVMLQYKGENHGLAKAENRKDYAVRMREFFDHHLMGKPAPDWWTDGVPHLKMDEHLKGRKE